MRTVTEIDALVIDDYGTEHLERIDWLEPLEVSGQFDLFGGAA